MVRIAFLWLALWLVVGGMGCNMKHGSVYEDLCELVVLSLRIVE